MVSTQIVIQAYCQSNESTRHWTVHPLVPYSPILSARAEHWAVQAEGQGRHAALVASQDCYSLEVI